MVADIKNAFLYGDVKRELFVKLPVEDPRRNDGSKTARLLKAMYGTRDAPQVWQDHICTVLAGRGFQESIGTAGVFQHNEIMLELAVHVDDLLCAGPTCHLEWFAAELLNRFELTYQILAPETLEVQEVCYLGRTIRWK